MHLLSVMMKVETLSKFLLFGTLATGEFIPARKIEQSLNPRDNSVGGWALSAISCPVGTTSCPIKDDNAPSCCPNEYNCQYDTTGVGKHYCCPGSEYIFHASPSLQIITLDASMIILSNLNLTPDDLQQQIVKLRSNHFLSVQTQAGSYMLKTHRTLVSRFSAAYQVNKAFLALVLVTTYSGRAETDQFRIQVL
jgi:hypothetical protein